MSRSFRLGAGVAACVLPLATLAAQPAPNPDLELAHHVLRRVTFGPTPDLVDRIVNFPMGSSAQAEAIAYIQAQLLPPAPGTSAYYGSADVEALVDGTHPFGPVFLPSPPVVGGPAPASTQIDTYSFQQPNISQLAYALDSEWQLREVMCQFWERHFNTHLVGSQFWFNNKIPAGSSNSAHAYYFEWVANEYYRANAFASFRDLIGFTSKHVSMVAYLHLDLNTVAGPNEDYARELLELYTMGPESFTIPPIQNYSQDDVETVARILTGWSVDPNSGFDFVFNAADHDTGPKRAMFPGQFTLPTGAAGQQEGELLLDELARMDATKEFICRKLIDEFLADGVADEALVAPVLTAMKSAWGTAGDMRAVLTALLTSSVFLGPDYRWARARLPLEAVVAQPRAFGGGFRRACPSNPAQLEPHAYSMTDTWIALEGMGQSLNNYPAPNGYPRASDAQLSPHSAVSRFGYAARVMFPAGVFPDPCASNPLATVANGMEFDLSALVVSELPTQPQWSNPLEVARLLLRSLYGTGYNAQDEASVVFSMVNASSVLYPSGTPGNYAPGLAGFEAVVRAGAVTAMGMSQGALR